MLSGFDIIPDTLSILSKYKTIKLILQSQHGAGIAGPVAWF
jgi:hypothetical protein